MPAHNQLALVGELQVDHAVWITEACYRNIILFSSCPPFVRIRYEFVLFQQDSA